MVSKHFGEQVASVFLSRTLSILLHPLPCLVRGEATLQVEQVAVGESLDHRVVSLVDVLSIRVEVGEV